MRTKYNRIRFFEEWLSAAEIGRRHGLSVPTVLRRYHVLGLREDELVVPPGALTPVASGKGRRYLSPRIPTPLQAHARLRRAKAAFGMAYERLANARAMGESKATIKRLERLLDRAEKRRMYCTAMVREAQQREEAA